MWKRKNTPKKSVTISPHGLTSQKNLLFKNSAILNTKYTYSGTYSSIKSWLHGITEELHISNDYKF